jgi:hypothetical protein
VTSAEILVEVGRHNWDAAPAVARPRLRPFRVHPASHSFKLLHRARQSIGNRHAIGNIDKGRAERVLGLKRRPSAHLVSYKSSIIYIMRIMP